LELASPSVRPRHPHSAWESDALPLGWCPDEDTRHNIIARRNVLTALWAGDLIGLSGPALTAYAVEVHLADYEFPGGADVVSKITADLHRAGLPVRPSEVRARFASFHREALNQNLATD
jgi:hypothetical protein